MSPKKEDLKTKVDPTASSSKKRKHPSDDPPTTQDFDLVWPQRNGVLGNPGELTIVLQIDPEDEGIDLEGSAGVIGRLEVDANGGECEE